MNETFKVSTRTLEVLEWNQLIKEIGDRARTDAGRLFIQEYRPALAEAFMLNLQAEAILELVQLKSENDFILPISDTPNLGNMLKRISRSGAITVEEFAALVRFQKIAQGLYHFLVRYGVHQPKLNEYLKGIELLEEWGGANFKLLDPQGQIVDSASEDLRALRSLTKELHQNIRDRLEDYLHNPKLAEIMQDYYVTLRDGRYVIPVKTNFRGRVPGIVHDVSKTEATLFVEPQEIVEWNNQLKVAEREIEKEIERILEEVVLRTKPSVGALERNVEILIRADLVSAFSKIVQDWGGRGSVAQDGDEILFKDLKHPLLALHREVVPNTLGWKSGFVLTGPNTGGKTVLLKSLGLAACLKWAGFPICAQTAVIPNDLLGIFADIGDDQSLEENLSTFSGHLLVLKQMLQNAKKGDLVLIDEIATGTSPEEGQPLAQAVIEELLNKNARVFVTTHYGGLKQFAMTDQRCRIASMSFDRDSRRPTYEVHLDIPGESSAFDVADQMGLPKKIISRARELRGDSPQDMREAVERLDQARRQLLDREKKLMEQEALAREREEKALAKVAEYETKQRQGLSNEAKDVLKGLHQLRDELSQMVRKASQEPSEIKTNSSQLFTKISETADTVRNVVESAGKYSPNSKAPEDKDLVAKQWVEVEGFGIAQIVETPKDLSRGPKAPILVQLGEMQMSVVRSRIFIPPPGEVNKYLAHRSANQLAREKKTSSVGSKDSKRSGSIICDVRGKSVEEAMRKLETALNEISKDELATVTVIHGHGNDRLKDSIRSYLIKERDELSFRSGTWPGEGGDGVTLVEKSNS